MTKAVFERTMENVVKQIDITFHNRKKKQLFGTRTKLSYYKVFHRTSISNRNENAEILTNKPVYFGLSILKLSKILMY